MLEKVKNTLDAVGSLHKATDAVIWLAGILVPSLVVNSSTLRFWIIGGGVLGGVLGYYVTARLWQGKGQPKTAIVVFLILALLSLCGFVFLLIVLKPDFAILNPTLEWIRELLLRTELLPNLLSAVLCGVTIWFGISFVTLLSSRLWSYSPPGASKTE